MLTYDLLLMFPDLTSRMLGMNLIDINSLIAEVQLYCARDRKRRCRRVGGGRRHILDLQTRLLLYLFWQHARPTQVVLCQMYGISRGSIVSTISDMHKTLMKLPNFRSKRCPRNHGTIHTVSAVIDEFPELENYGGVMI
jgi:hypothetical protein